MQPFWAGEYYSHHLSFLRKCFAKNCIGLDFAMKYEDVGFVLEDSVQVADSHDLQKLLMFGKWGKLHHYTRAALTHSMEYDIVDLTE